MIKNLVFAVIFLTGIIRINAQHRNYFPLAPGNQWEFFDGTGFTYGEVEKDTILSNGKKYFTLSPSVAEFSFIRADSLGNIYSAGSLFIPSDTAEVLLLKQDAKPGETWIMHITEGVPFPDTIRGKCFFEGMGDLFGEIRNVKGVMVTGPAGEYASYYFAEGIGIAKEVYEDKSEALITYANIDGTSFGNLHSSREKRLGPDNLTVSQNYPNPFSSTTSIDIHIPLDKGRAREFHFAICDTTGKILFERKYIIRNNRQNIKFNLDADNFNLPGGKYLYRVRAGNETVTKKMVYRKKY